MSDFLIFKAAFNNSVTPAIGTYTVEGGAAHFNINTSLSPDYYMYAATAENPIKWFVPTAVVTDFEFVCDILTRTSEFGIAPYFTIADSNGVTKLRMESQYSNIRFMSDDTHGQSSSVICLTNPTDIGGYDIFHQFRIRVRKLTDSSSSVEVYANDNLVTSGTSPALITCGKISFLGAAEAFATGKTMGVKNAYVCDLSGGDVVDRGVLSNAFTRFISWMKSKFALKSDIPTVNNGTLTIQQNGVNVQTFTANQSTAATANITVPTAVSELTNDSGYLTSSSNLDASKLTSGTVDIARLPQGALERLIKVANEAARYALTTADVQLGDTVQQLDTGIMYVVTDTDHLDSAAGYTEYTAGTAASVPWSGVTGKPTFAAVATSGAYSDLTGKPALAAVATSGAYSDLTGTPTIPTVNNATLTIQQNGTNVQTFTANQSTNATANITVPTKTSDLTNDSGFITSDNTKIPLAGSNAISGSLIPNTDNSIDVGSSTKNIKMLYTKGITIDGTQFLPSDYIPRSGGAVMTGENLARIDNNSSLRIDGGRTGIGGASLGLWGAESLARPGQIRIQPLQSSTVLATMFLMPDGTWTWSGTAVQITSDQRLKQQISEIDDKLLDAWEDVELVQFKYNESVDTKGKSARLHTGYVVQQIDSACKSHNVDISEYGLYCHEEYPEETKEVEVEQADGTKTKERKVIREASEHYSLRYTEVYAVECMYLRRCIARLTARIEELEKGKEQEASE